MIRHYSLIGGAGGRDDAADCFRIAIRREAPGNGSAFLHEGIALGSRIAVSAPRNEFPLVPMSQHSLLVAGGIGITPLYSMVRKLVRTSRSFELHYCGRDLAQLAYVDDLRTLAGDRFHLHVTDGDPTRRLDLAALVARQPAGTHSYVCGPVRLVEAMHAAAAQAGWGPGRVHSEVFTEALAPDEACFDVVLRKSGMTISVGPRDSILSALEAAGFPAISDCRRGECGICPLPILEADGVIVHRDRCLEAKHRGARLCVCVSRLQGRRLVLDA